MVLLPYYSLTFISGLFIGSFLNVVSDRTISEKSATKGRSECESCGKNLGPLELIPVISFLLQRGKCTSCKSTLSWYYPLSEILTGMLFLLVVQHLEPFSRSAPAYIWVVLAYLLVVTCFFIILLLTDLKYYLLPNKIVFPAIYFVLAFLTFNLVFSIGYSYYQMSIDPLGKYLLEVGFWELQSWRSFDAYLYTLLSSGVIYIFFWLLTKIKNGQAMGGGDVKLAFLIGLVVGFPNNILAIFLGFFTGALVSLGLIIFKLKSVKDIVPFGPFLIFGCFLALIWGEEILNFYFNLF